MSNNLKVAYKRCSTNESKQDVSRQLFGIAFDKEFIEYASGKNEKDRPVFKECLEFVSKGNELYFQDLSRAGRNATELQITVEKLIKRGVKVVFVSEGLSFVGEGGDPMAQAISKMMLTMLAAVNELFLTQTSVAVKQGLKKAVAMGKKLGASNQKHKETYQANKAAGLHKPRKEKVARVEHLDKIKEEFLNVIHLMKDKKLANNKKSYANIGRNLDMLNVKRDTNTKWTSGSVIKAIEYYEVSL